MAMRHPIHPMLAHFPVACWSLATLADLASLHYHQPAWQLAGALMAIGCVMAVLAVLAGLVEFARVPDDPVVLRDAYTHMGLMALALALYVASLVLRVEQLALVAPGAAALSLSVIGFIALTAGGWMGGRLVYGHGVGGSAPPAARADDATSRQAPGS